MRSIERYLLAWVMGAMSLGAVLVVFVFYLVALDEMGEILDADLQNIAEALAGLPRDRSDEQLAGCWAQIHEQQRPIRNRDARMEQQR